MFYVLDTFQDVIIWVLGAVALLGGSVLVVRGLMDFIGGLWKSPKDFKQVATGVIIGFVGGWLALMSGSALYNFFKSNGQDIPLG